MKHIFLVWLIFMILAAIGYFVLVHLVEDSTREQPKVEERVNGTSTDPIVIILT